MTDPTIAIRQLGRCEYTPILERMKSFTAERSADAADEIWLLEHEAVFTLGQAGKPHHVLDAGEIAVVNSDRGGQVTYHGPGQLVMYTLLDIRRAGVGVRELVTLLEQTVVQFLAGHRINAASRADAPGVYVDGAKIAALGLRISRGSSYHGLSLNVDMDMQPFTRINPCGFENLPVISLSDLGVDLELAEAADQLVSCFQQLYPPRR